MNLNHRHLLSSAALWVATLGLVSCSGPTYREVRTPVPGGGYNVMRIKISDGSRPFLGPRPPSSQAKPAAATASAQRPAPPSNGGFFGGFLRMITGQPAPKAPAPRPEDIGFWRGDGIEGKPSLRISLGEQKVYFLKAGEIVGMSPISSGRESYATRPGKFAIIEKDLDHKSNLYGDYVSKTGEILKKEIDVRKDPLPPGGVFDGANMRYFMRITGAIGMHEGYLPGFPASHGCIRLPSRMAEIFYNETPMGTPVEIVP